MRTIAEILAYCEMATPGPWKANKGDKSLVIRGDSEPWDDAFFVEFKDAEFCANAREDLPRLAKLVMELRELLDTCDALEAEREKLAKCLRRFGVVPDAPESDLRTAVDDWIALAHQNADERIEAMAERDRLRDEVAEYKHAWREIMDEPCPESDDRKHCTCVPALRSGIQELKAERDAAKETLEAFKALCREVGDLFYGRYLYQDEKEMILRLREAGKEEA